MRVGKVWGSVHGVKVIAREKRARGLGLPDMAPLPVLSRSTPAKTGAKESALLYNEYVVYDVAQVRQRFALQCFCKNVVHAA